MTIPSGRSKTRSIVVVLALAALTVAGSVSVVTRTTNAQAAVGTLAAAVEDEGADCAVSGLPDLGSLPTNAKLPDPFKKLDGTRITTKSDWRCRREEIKKLAEKLRLRREARQAGERHRDGLQHQHHRERDPQRQELQLLGAASSCRAAPVPSRPSSSSAGSARTRPPSRPPAPPSSATTRSRSAGRARPATTSRARSTASTAPPAAPDCCRPGPGASAGSSTSSSSPAAASSRRTRWASPAAPGYGKGAFAIGVFDQRIALTMPIESGSAGVPIFRGIPGEGAQTPEQRLRGATVAGRRVRLLHRQPEHAAGGHPRDGGHGRAARTVHHGQPAHRQPRPPVGSVAALGGAEVYKALGAGDNITYWSDVQDGTHCAIRPEWRTPLQQNIQKFLLKTGNAAGTIRISSQGAGNLADWRDWTTPILTDGPTTRRRPRRRPRRRRPRRRRPPRRRPRRPRPVVAVRRRCRSTSGRAVSSPRCG